MVNLFYKSNQARLNAYNKQRSQDLINQLNKNGRMVIPVGEKTQIMTLITKNENGDVNEEKLGEFKFVPMLQDKEWK